jgi:hypothetical protein
MTSKSKQNVLIYMIFVLLGTNLLAAGLPQMELKQGLPAPGYTGGQIIIPEITLSSHLNMDIHPFILRLFGILVAVSLVVILGLILSGKGWKKVLKHFLAYTLLLGGFIIFIFFVYLLRSLPLEPAELLPRPTPPEPPLTTPLGSPPVSLTWLVGICLALIAAILLYTWLRARRKLDQTALLVKQVENARQNLLSGMNLDEVILRCYQQMSLVLQQEGGIERQSFTTPAEFEDQLIAAEFPKEPIHQLTHLFEIVRYGHGSPTSADEQEALSSLQKIVAHLKEKRAAGNA